MTALLSSLNHARLEASEPRLANSNRAETIDLEAARHAITKNASGLAIDMTDGTNELAEKVSGQQYAFSPGSKSFPDGSILSPKPSPTTCDYQPPLMHTTAIPYDFPSPQTTPLQAKLPCFSTMQTSDGQTAYAEMPLKQPLQRRLAVRNIVIAAFGEFLGTFLFLFFAMAINTTVSAVKDAEKAAGDNSSDLTALLVSSLGFGFSLAVSVWIFYRVSGGVQNPAITLALALIGAMSWTKFVVLTVVQYLAGIAAAGLISGLYPNIVNSRSTLAGDVSEVRGFWIEFFMAVLLIFTVLMLAVEKHNATFLAPIGIGLALFVTQLFGQPYTGAGVNPARTLGPDAVEHSFDRSCWIYYLAPYSAAVATSLCYLALKHVQFETATPGQDADDCRAGYIRQVLCDVQGNVLGTVEFLKEDELAAKAAKSKKERLAAPRTDVTKAHGEGVDLIIDPDQTFASPCVSDSSGKSIPVNCKSSQ